MTTSFAKSRMKILLLEGVHDRAVDRVGEQADERILGGHARAQLVGWYRPGAGVEIDVGHLAQFREYRRRQLACDEGVESGHRVI